MREMVELASGGSLFQLHEHASSYALRLTNFWLNLAIRTMSTIRDSTNRETRPKRVIARRQKSAGVDDGHGSNMDIWSESPSVSLDKPSIPHMLMSPPPEETLRVSGRGICTALKLTKSTIRLHAENTLQKHVYSLLSRRQHGHRLPWPNVNVLGILLCLASPPLWLKTMGNPAQVARRCL